LLELVVSRGYPSVSQLVRGIIQEYLKNNNALREREDK
jgi:hypothetical protein